MAIVSADFFRELYDYVYWGRDRILDTAAALTEEQLNDSSVRLDYASIRHTLVHELSAECVFRDRWRGLNPRESIQSTDLLTLDAIRERWEAEEQTMRSYLAKLTDSQVVENYEYTSASGQAYQQPRWESMFQIINHSTQHRSELALVLTQLGHSPGILDYSFYLRQRANA